MLQPLTGGLTPLGAGRRAGDYASKVLATAPANLLAYWKLDETGGTTAYDSSGHGRNGTYSGVALNTSSFLDGSPAPSFNGINDYVDVYSSSLAAAFNGNEGTFIAWGKVHDSSVWSDGSNRRLIHFVSTLGTSNRIILSRPLADNSFLLQRSASGNLGVTATLSNTDYVLYALAWSKVSDQVKAFINGSQVGTTQTGLQSFSGALATDSAVIGAHSSGGTLSWRGSIAHVALWDVALSAAQITSLASV